MKKLILALLAVGSVAFANAQSNSVLLYGNVGMSNYSDSMNTNMFSWNINPGIGYQFDQHWTLGLSLGYAQNSNRPDGGTRTNTNDYNVGAFGRYTHNISGIFYCYGQLDMGYWGGNQTGNFPTDRIYNGFYAKFNPAVGAHIKNGWSLNFSVGGLGFMTRKYNETANSSNSFGITFGQQVNIGLSKNFQCHHRVCSDHSMGEDNHKMKADADDDDDAPKKKAKKMRKDDDE
jgi:hypothetical protein